MLKYVGITAAVVVLGQLLGVLLSDLLGGLLGGPLGQPAWLCYLATTRL